MQEEIDDSKYVCLEVPGTLCLCKEHLVEIVLRLQYDAVRYSSVVFPPTI